MSGEEPYLLRLPLLRPNRSAPWQRLSAVRAEDDVEQQAANDPHARGFQAHAIGVVLNAGAAIRAFSHAYLPGVAVGAGDSDDQPDPQNLALVLSLKAPFRRVWYWFS